MGFSFESMGSRDDVARKLENLTFDGDLHGDEMGDEVSNIIAAYIRNGGEAGQGLQYVVKASGHSGKGEDRHTIWLNVHVSVEPAGPAGEKYAGSHRLVEEAPAAVS